MIGMDRLEYLQWLKRETSNGFYTTEQIIEKLLDALISDEAAAKAFHVNKASSHNP